MKQKKNNQHKIIREKVRFQMNALRKRTLFCLGEEPPQLLRWLPWGNYLRNRLFATMPELISAMAVTLASPRSRVYRTEPEPVSRMA